MPLRKKRVDSIKPRKTQKRGEACSEVIIQLILSALFFGAMTVLIIATTEESVTYNGQNGSQSNATTTLEQSIKKEDKTSQKAKIQAKTPHQESLIQHKEEMAQQIAEVFSENPVTMVAIALAENRTLDPKKTNYNCFYKLGGDTYDSLIQRNIDLNSISRERLKGYVSTWCRSGHQKYAWSTDGGLLQVNDPKPEHYTVEGNLEEARRKYELQGFKAWTTYKSEEYKKYLALAGELLKK